MYMYMYTQYEPMDQCEVSTDLYQQCETEEDEALQGHVDKQ